MRTLQTILMAALLLALAAGCRSTRPLISRDPATASLLAEGQQQLRQKQYEAAVASFEKAALRPSSQQSTAATYLAGISNYYAGNDFAASDYFSQLLRGWPKSKYAPDARYHTALLQLKKYAQADQFRGLNALTELAEGKNTLSADARQAFQEFLFRQKPEYVNQYLAVAPAPAQLAALEVACCHKAQAGDFKSAREAYARHRSAGGAASPYLESLLKESAPAASTAPKPVSEIRIAMLLPLFGADLGYGDRNVPEKSRTALEFYEGFRMAAEDYQAIAMRKVYIKLSDTRRDTFIIKQQLKALETLKPQVVVGEIYTDACAPIANWAKRTRTVQVLPFSVHRGLIRDTAGYTFLARPSARAHGARMGEYAAQSLKLSQVVIWSDGRRNTQELVDGFSAAFKAAKGRVRILTVDSVFRGGMAQKDILRHFKESLSSWSGIDGVYIALSDQESAGLILSTMTVQLSRGQLRVMGSPDWAHYNLIGDREKSYFGLIYSAAFAPHNEPESYQKFYERYFSTYSLPPSEAAAQGYGLGYYLLQLLDVHDPRMMSLRKFLQVSEPFRAIQADYQFAGARDNQRVHIFEYQDGQLFLVGRKE